MHRLLASVLLICIAAGNVVSQQQKPLPTPTPETAKPGVVIKETTVQTTTTTVIPRSQRRRQNARLIAKLRKENKRLRAMLARQKRPVHRRHKHVAKQKRKVVNTTKIVTTTTALTDAQMETIANKVYAKFIDKNIPVALSQKDLEKIAALVKAQTPVAPLIIAPGSEQGQSPAAQEVATVFWAATAWTWDNLWYILGGVVLLLLAIALWDLFRKSNELEPTWTRRKFEKIVNWRTKDNEVPSFNLEEKMYGDVTNEAGVGEVKKVGVEPIADEDSAPSSIAVVEEKAVKKVFILDPAAGPETSS